MTPESDATQFFGRADLVESARSSDAPLTLLVGDSGIGKTALLRHVQRDFQGALAPAPVEVFSRDGAFVDAILDVMVDAVGQIIADDVWSTRRHQAEEFLAKLARRSGGLVIQLIQEALLQRLRLWFGERSIQLASEFKDVFGSTESNGLSTSVEAARSDNVLPELVTFASEILEVSGRDEFSIGLDRIEILPETDIRRLADLARMLPARVGLKATLQDTSEEGARTLQLLDSVGGYDVRTIRVDGLSESAVREALVAAGLDEARTPEVHHQTGGYPLHLGDLIRHLETGGQLGSEPINAKFGKLIQSRWDGLTPTCRTAARQLCMIGRPLPVQLVLETLEVGESDWFNTVDTLKSERIFTQTVDGQPWFHEQRRRWLVDSLSPTERQSGAARIIPAVSELAQSQVGWRYGPTLAELIEEAGTEIVDPDFKRLSVLSDSELAIAAALLELDSTRSNPTDAAAALAHARRFFGADGDLVAALERLTLAGLTAVEQVLPGRVPLVEMSFGRAIAVAVGGMCHRRLGRMPIPAIGLAAWTDVLGTPNSPKKFAVCGIGEPIPGDVIWETHIAEGRATRTLRPLHGCYAAGDLGGTPIFAVATTDPGQERQLAAAWADAKGELGGRTLEVHQVLEFPATRFRAGRWSVAANDLVGRPPSAKEDSGLALQDDVRVLSDIREAARLAMDPVDQLLTGMIKPMHFYYQEDFGRSTVLRVLGQSAGVTSCSTLDIGRFGSPLASLHYAEHLQLPYGCEVVGMTTGARLDRAHPMRRFAKQTDERLVSFNRHHPRIEVDIREGYLEQWLGPYLEDRYQDARGLYDAVSMAGFFEPTPYEVFLVAAPSSPESPVSSVFAWSALRPSDEMKINYRLFEAPGKVSGLNVLPEVFPQYTSPSFSSGSLAATLADVAGYGKDDVSIFQSIRDLELLPN